MLCCWCGSYWDDPSAHRVCKMRILPLSYMQKTYCAKVVFTCFTLQTAWIMTKYHDNLLPITLWLLHCRPSYAVCWVHSHTSCAFYLSTIYTELFCTILLHVMAHNLWYSIRAMGKWLYEKHTHLWNYTYQSTKHSVFHIHSIIYYLRIVWTCTHRVYLFL